VAQSASASTSAFTGTIPALYEKHLVPVIFDPYARDLVARVPDRAGVAVLEVACGTGAVTRGLLGRLPASARLVATDLNQGMIEVARSLTPADPRLEWRAADGTALPFADGEFDAVVCQFGIMFFPDKLAGMREARRLLKPGGRYLFNVWDAFEHNAFGRVTHATIASFFESDPPAFYLTPFGYHGVEVIERTLREAGFGEIRIERVQKELTGPSARDFATGLVRGNPVALSIAERGVDQERVVGAVAEALRPFYGDGPMRGTIRAVVVTAVA
jgi:ubiquinone/menaquinone biosynthesis C-methylase UbiE